MPPTAMIARPLGLSLTVGAEHAVDLAAAAGGYTYDEVRQTAVGTGPQLTKVTFKTSNPPDDYDVE